MVYDLLIGSHTIKVNKKFDAKRPPPCFANIGDCLLLFHPNPSISENNQLAIDYSAHAIEICLCL
jgi:hypothetical protein